MIDRNATPAPPIEWGVAGRPLAGERRSGDHHLVKSLPSGVLVAVVDGLGHGDEAADAARTAIATLEAGAGQALTALVERCHERLKRTRGVALSLASFNTLADSMEWLGIGNVEGLLLRADAAASRASEHLLQRGGVVGYRLPPLHLATLPVRRGDTLIFATDGIRSRFAEGLILSESPQGMADRILGQHGKTTDDALVLVARYAGGGR